MLSLWRFSSPNQHRHSQGSKAQSTGLIGSDIKKNGGPGRWKYSSLVTLTLMIIASSASEAIPSASTLPQDLEILDIELSIVFKELDW